MSDSYRICVVCWGNICRSPMAEFVIRAALAEAGLGDRVVVDSAGTSTDELGQRMDPRTLTTLRRHDVPDTGFDEHRARQITPSWLADRDLVLAADHVHVRLLEELAPGAGDRGQVRLLRSFDPASVAAADLGMADPWYGDDGDFDTTYAEIVAAVPGLLEHVRARLDEATRT